MMAEQLKPPQGQQWNHATGVQAVGRGIKTGINSNGSFADAFSQRVRIRAIGHQTPPLEFFQNIHRRQIKLAECVFQPRVSITVGMRVRLG